MNLIHRIKSIKKLNGDTFLFRIKSPEIAEKAKAGQFVNVKCGDAYLRRPISICSVDREGDTFDIGVQVRGKGTENLCNAFVSDPIDIMGPLGKGFSFDEKDECIAVLGGGIGVFPLLQLLKDHPAKRKIALLGFRNHESVIMVDTFAEACDELLVSTDDGSYGIKGFVTSLLEKRLSEERIDRVFMCGPTIMMKHAVHICCEKGIATEVSMEQRMGCGVGACLVCACKTKAGEDWTYSHVCTDGPVFDGDSVQFD